MNARSQLEIPSMQSKVSPEEWTARVDLAACYRLVADFGWDDLVFTHISARVPGTQDQFLINPYGMMFEEITASSLIKVDAQGNKLMESAFPVNPAGFTIHSAVHGARHDIACVLHTHSLNGVAVSAQEGGCCRCRSNPYSSWPASLTITTRAWHCAMRRSRGSPPTSATRLF